MFSIVFDKAFVILLFEFCSNFYLVTCKEVPPEVWLGGCNKFENGSSNLKYYRFSPYLSDLQNYQNECVRKISNNIICPRTTESVFFVCEAAYPISWKYPGYEHITADYSVSSKFNANSGQPVSNSYAGILRIPCHTSSALAANISCESTGLSEKLSTSFYISKFLKDVQFAFVEINVTLTTEPGNKTLPSLVLPCRPINTNQTVVLEKLVATKSGKGSTPQKKWIKANFTTAEMTYNSSIGFTIDTRKLSVDSLLGEYRCSVNQITDFVYFNVLATAKKPQMFVPVVNFTGNASMTIKPFYKAKQPPQKQIQCCSGLPGKPPAIETLECYSQEDCVTMQDRILQNFASHQRRQQKSGSKTSDKNSDCSTKPAYAFASLVICKGENINVSETYGDVFHAMSNLPVNERAKRILADDRMSNNTKRKYVPLMSRYALVSDFEKLEAQQKVLLVVAKRSNTTAHFEVDSRLKLHVGFDTLFRENLTNICREQFNETKDIYNHPDLREIDRVAYNEGEHITVLCFGIKFFHSNGAKLIVKWKNGTKTNMGLEDSLARQGRQLVFLNGNEFVFSGDGNRAISIVSKEITATQSMDSIECWMPRISSSKWDTLVKKMQVNKPNSS